MKKMLVLIMIGLVLLSGMSVFADEVPTLISLERFTTTQDGDNFTITLDENLGVWDYTINKIDHVTFVSDEKTGVMRTFSFKVNDLGVSTISFVQNDSNQTLEIMVYKASGNLYIEEDQVVSHYDFVEHTSSGIEVSYNDLLIEYDVMPEVVDGVTMIPLSSTLKAMGYDVKWVSETRSVEISKDAQWTSITIDKNSYFKNRMAASPLSSAPIIKDGRTLVPAEFFTTILDKGCIVEDGNFKLNDYGFATYSGYVKEINTDNKGNISITLGNDLESLDMMNATIIHTSANTTYTNVEIVEGAFINVVASMMSTMSIPPQTSGYIIY